MIAMDCMRARVMVALALLSSAAAAEAARIEIAHQPLPCVVADRFVRIAARGTPPPRSAEVQFRTDADGPWYALAMTAGNGEWSAVLPRPMASLTGFEYRISMAGEGGETSQTPAYAVKVGADAAACGAASLSAVDASIAVRVPYGAPVVPPVPRGFNPSGVTGTAEPAPPEGPKKALLIGGAVAAAGGVAALALGGGSDAAAPPDLPEFTLEGSIPASGSTVSVSRDTIQVLVRMDREPTEPLTLDWRVEWRATAAGFVCVTMAGTFNGAQRPTGLVLTGPFLYIPFCGTNGFDAAFAHLVINTGGHNAFAQTVPLNFRFVP
jgi:hypothetical protein